MPLHIPRAAIPLEGDYTTWAHVWTRDYGAGVNLNEIAVDNLGTVHAEDISVPNTYVKTYGGAETNINNYASLIWQRITSVSVTGKYFSGAEKITYRKFEVWKDGVQLFNRDVQLDEPNAGSVYYVSISPNGKFVALIITKLVTFNEQIMMLYEGA